MIPLPNSGFRIARRGGCSLLLMATVVGLLLRALGQTSGSDFCFADYLNRVFVTAPTNTNAGSRAVAFFSGSIGAVTNPATPRSGNFVLKASSFGQPVAGAPFVAPDFNLGDQIVGPNGATNGQFSSKAFSVGTAVFAADSGFITISWQMADGSVIRKTYFVSSSPGTTNFMQRIYQTELTDLSSLNGTATNTLAPTVDLSAVNVVLHNNSALPSNSVYVANNKLHARDNTGRMVLELHNTNANRAFLGLQVIEVEPCVADKTDGPFDVGSFLAPATIDARALTRPYISRGLTNYAPFVYQYNLPGDPRDGLVFPTQSTTNHATFSLDVNKIELFWLRLGFANLVWPYEMHHYAADWPANFSQVAKRLYLTQTNGTPTLAPTVDLSPLPNPTIYYNADIPRDADPLNPQPQPVFLWTDAASRLNAQDRVGRILLQYTNLALEFLDVRPYAIDTNTTVVVGQFLGPSVTVPSPARLYVPQPLLTGLPFVCQLTIEGGDPNDGNAFVVRPSIFSDQLDVFWTQVGISNTVWPYEMHRYVSDWPANFPQIAQRIYHTLRPDNSPTGAPEITVPSSVPNVVIHYNSVIPPDTGSNGVHTTVWQQPQARTLAAKQGYTGRLLIHYDNGNLPSFLGVEYVDVRPYLPDYTNNYFVGDRLWPTVQVTNDPSPPDPKVSRGIDQSPTPLDPPDYVYQHNVPGAMKGDVFAVRTNFVAGGVEVFWLQHGQLGLIWPYEMHWYLASWPASRPDKYQLYVRGTSPVLGPDVFIPSGLTASRMPSQEPAHHALDVATNSFFATNAGWSLLKYTAGELVDFQVVRSVLHTDQLALTNQTAANWNIGTEIRDAYHQGPRPGYIYVPAVSPHTWDRYDPQTYDPTNTQQIFAVNKSAMEIWWSNLKTNLGQTVQWPSLVKLYNTVWPSPAPETIVIASQAGSGVISNASIFSIYSQNDPALPGFNPNDEHALLLQSGGGTAVFALRNDLGTSATSDPWVLLRYLRSDTGNWAYRVFQVVDQQGTNVFSYPLIAGNEINPPFPLSTLQVPPNNYGVSGPFWRDRQLNFWAIQAGNDNGQTNIVMRYYYPVQPGFYFPDANVAAGGTNVNAVVAWLDRLPGGTPGTPVNVTNVISWPTDPPILHLAETEVGAKSTLNNAADIGTQTSVEIVYQQNVALGGSPSVKLIDPTRTRQVLLDHVPVGASTLTDKGLVYFPSLPPHLRSRVWYDPNQNTLNLKGQYVVPPAGEYYLLLNILTARDSNQLAAVTAQDPGFTSAVSALAALPLIEVPANAPFTHPLALTAGAATNGGWVTLAFNNSTNLNQPGDTITLEVRQVQCPTYQGELKVINSENPFDQNITLRHSGDFAGRADQYQFEWKRAVPVNGLPPGGVSVGPPNPDLYDAYIPNPSDGRGALDITVGASGSSGIDTLSDHYFICRYRLFTNPPCATSSNLFGWSEWTSPQLQEGWVKRVLDAINPFDQRVTDYANSQVDTVVSMIGQAGARSIGNVPLNQQAANSFGLIEIYETVFRTAMGLNASGTPPGGYPPVNSALLLAAGRIADLYMLLGNEAFADAADPTIAFGTDDKQYGQFSTSVHCFENQTASLLEEELALLRGRDDTLLPPVSTYPTYNRLIWNFTHDINGGEVAYALNYNLKDVSGPNGVPDGVIDAYDGKAMYPQGHGDAWGHYLTAIKNYYDLLRNTHFTWVPQIEAVQVGGVPVSVDYLHERKFAQAAGAKARTGAEIVSLTYRNAYVENPQGQWQGYIDANTNRAWGVSEWGSRAGQGAYYDWVVGNAILPPAYSASYKLTQQGLDVIGAQSIYYFTEDALARAASSAGINLSSSLLSELRTMTNQQIVGRSAFLADLDIDYRLFVQGTLFNRGAGGAAAAAALGALTSELASNSLQTVSAAATAAARNDASVQAALTNAQALQAALPYADSRYVNAVNSLVTAAGGAAAATASSGQTNLAAIGVAATNAVMVAVSNAVAAIGSGTGNALQTAILSQSQTNGLPESDFQALTLFGGSVFSSLNDLEAALQSTNYLGPTAFTTYFDSLIRTNLQLPPANGQPASGLQEVDRSTVSELGDISAAALTIQQQVDAADSGLNPLGLSKNAIPFDIDPNLVSQGKTHFEQIYDRAVQALNNAIVAFNNADNSTQLLRRQADSLADFQKTVQNQEADFTNRLIEIFGYPYPEDIGAGGTYPNGYQGPDTEAFHFNYIDSFDLTGVLPPNSTAVTHAFASLSYDTNGGLSQIVTNVTINLSTDGLEFIKPAGWSRRQATGQIQKSLSEVLQARVRFERSLAEYDNLISQIEDQANLIQSQFNIDASEIQILNEGNQSQKSLNDEIMNARQTQVDARTSAQIMTLMGGAMAEMLPTDVGLASDVTSAIRGAIRLVAGEVSQVFSSQADEASLAELGYQQAKEQAQALTNLRLTTLHQEQPILQQLAQIEQLIRQEVLSRLDIYTQREAMQQSAEAYRSTLAQGLRILEDRLRFRQQTAAQIQSDRYKDMAFRIFRNDALQKYRAQFDLAAAYVYLAARAYDYETNLRTNDNRGPGQKFMTDIIRSRAIGLIQNGSPIVGNGVGDPGLADPMARMISDWNLVLKGQLGFNNPETETGRFSMRSELFRVQTNRTAAVANTAWREILRRSVVSNLFDLPEFQRYCIPFTPSQPVEPGFVIPFSTTINFGQNFFGWPLGGGDNSYDSSHFATKIRSVGVWFANYDNTSLANQPRVYLIPVGSDVMTSPPRFPGDAPFTREWKILDQQLPVPFPLSPGDITDQTYIPINDSLIGDYADIRKYASFRAYQDAGFTTAEMTFSSRLIGRSVWNDHWLLIIPAGTLLSDRNLAMQYFIYGPQNDGNGVTDIEVFFQTYSYAGN